MGKKGKDKSAKPLRRMESLSSRFYIGIDLGTTNSSVAYIDRLSEEGATSINVFKVPQVSAPGVIEDFDLLPSFFYFPAGFELADGAINLPWKGGCEYVVGKFARAQGAIVPNRMISSVKSWLCNPRIDRQKKVLPWNKDNNMTGFSPVEVSAFYLCHIKEAWNHTMSGGDPDYMFENQEIIITVPASFDEVARELTLKSAKMAGLANVTLVEEPQAAFYYWIYKNRVDWDKKLKDGDIILICDVGGGTTDFTLIHASKNAEDILELKRIAVGDHILLGGDNMDMSIAHHIETSRIKDGARLDALTWTSLCMKCRSLKEELLDKNNKNGQDSISITGRGRSVVGNTMKFTLSKDEISKIILDGFLNDVDFKTIDKKIKSSAGLRESGLPYAEDPSVSNHLARFLKRHVTDVSGERNREFVHPDKILFNGGVFKSEAIRRRISELVSGWVGVKPGAAGNDGGLTVLENSDLDLAVSLGAAYYAYAKSGNGIRIKSGSARSYYIGVSGGESEQAYRSNREEKAVCLVTRGMEEGRKSTLEEGFQIITNQPVQFTLYSSTVNEGTAGQIIAIDDENYIKLPPLYTCLTYGKKSKSPRIDVTLAAYLSETGTIDLYCISKSSEHRWKLQFNFRRHEMELSRETPGDRPATQISNEKERAAERKSPETGECAAETSQTVTEEMIGQAGHIIETAFTAPGPEGARLASRAIKDIEASLNIRKEQWRPEFLRALFQAVLKTADCRGVSGTHEERWLNLAGFLLRPGFGVQMDEWRVKEALRVTFGGVKFKSNKAGMINYYIFLRRIAGGMTAGQQAELYNKTLKELLFSNKKQNDRPFRIVANNQEQVELVRLAASLELLSQNDKNHIGNQISRAIHRDGPDPISVWALSRIGARRLVYGGSECVTAPEAAEKWIEKLLDFDWVKESYMPYSVIMMARVTGDRKLDLSPEVMERVQKRLEECPQSEHLYDLLMNMAAMNEDDQKLFFGESLPQGIVMADKQ